VSSPPDAGSLYDRTVFRWGQSTEMSDYEAALWHMSDRPTLRAASVVVEVLDLAPDWERLVAGHAWALGRVPRLRQRVVSDPVRIGPPAWAGSQVDLDHHLRRVQLPPGAGLGDVLDVASEMHEATFDPKRPLWLAALVEGLPGRRAAYILKFHHAMADDLALVALFELLHSHVRKPTVSVPQLPTGWHEAHTPLGLSARHALGMVHRAPRAAARLYARSARAGAALAHDPVGGARRGIALGQSAGQALASVRWQGSALLAGRGPRRSFHTIDIPTDRLRTAGASAGARIGDVALAATVDALARYHRALGTPTGALPVAIPLHVRLDGRGDRLPRARILVPTEQPNASERIATMARLVAQAETRSHVDVLRAAAPVLSRAPTLVFGRVMERSNRPLALQGFIVRGLNRDAYLAGARVLRMFTFAPTAGCALSMTLVTHQATSCIGFNLDTAAIAEPELLRRSLHDAFADVLERR
jgi:diacylglycerol O-acyltransferase / wax synthase